MSHKLFLAWLQLTREKARLLVATAGIAFAVILMFMQLGFQAALSESATRVHESLNADLVMINPRSRALMSMNNFSRRRLYQALGFDGVESINSVYVGLGTWKSPASQRDRAILVLGIDPSKITLHIPEINQYLNKLKLDDVAILDRVSRPEFKPFITEVAQGNTIAPEINGRKIKVVGLFTVGSSFGSDALLITSELNFLRIFKTRAASDINIGLVKVAPNRNIGRIAQAIQASLPKDIQVLTHDEFVQFEKNYWQKNTAIGFVFTLGTIMGFIVGSVIVYQVLYTNVSDHLAEYATLKAMGYKDSYLLIMVFQEALILAILGYIPGFALTLGLYDLTRKATSLPMAMDTWRASLSLILTILMCFISGAIAVRKLQAADPADIF
ncbi:ABC transporter permease DevC [Chroococcidiopsis sp. CCNUC1]|uniref:ABC transporter permease DevC n=1 Tax=Chroococcidiopsis sp. CCNUC1 TaxID=2653189 RepID=UPI00202247E8|nr:ABC transporter permease DevC [Chroococcidiopsis sp. CCNUC1]URD53446.1 ABC transporter permease DevC [Chroococcidiopsis sp. CCNUC1]